ncbi:DUF2063 domain-containing protein [Roseobacter denitrificans]|uniref:Putative DNA-binding domain-containing protein n=1 Tax=Roseobacter denitrificans (strain ATCC 33942 / OCh 114) TaxID=375451 RepID=Q168V3_ROSDO|nr:DNA-binding domain-containing protein [Roseobacter denitrificans]ABG31490.1 conserved hypothetical protein [Roseobacter denitrificans OCh 114]AVL54492.1 DUF2063 domain-containing protein [Roseobacter denitrificans]SFF90786.1 Putative DNA-binding domain-containing protein [Roseobacter denitrificans OCh 114]
MTVEQTQFRAALLDAQAAVPPGLSDGAGAPAGNRFSVYRNNVIVSLSEALTVAFPLLVKLLGAQGFGQLAGIYARQNPPQSPLMMHYGATLPAFLEGFEPLAHLGYLADCARLDIEMRKSYHAAEAANLNPEVFQRDETALMQVQLRLKPSSRVLRSRWPLYDIWAFNMTEGAAKPRAIAQDVIITRPEFDPTPHLLAPGSADWLDALHAGEIFVAACEAAASSFQDFDLTTSLTQAITTQALTEYTTKETP